MRSYHDTEYKILGNLLRSCLESKSLHQISKETGLSYVTVHKLVPDLIRKKLVRLEIKGRSHLVSIDFDNASTDMLSSSMIYEKNRFLKNHLNILLLSRDIEEGLAGSFYILLLFGSYAKGRATDKSDVDLLLVIPDRKNIEFYDEKISRKTELFTGTVDYKIISIKDLEEMLNQKHTVGREAFNNNLVLFGTEVYYSMVKEYVRSKGY